MDDTIKKNEDEVGSSGCSRPRSSLVRFLWLTEIAIFLVLWGVCILCILNLNEKQRATLSWVEDVFNSRSQDRDTDIIALSDIYADDAYSFVLCKNGGQAISVAEYMKAFNPMKELSSSETSQKPDEIEAPAPEQDNRLAMDFGRRQDGASGGQTMRDALDVDVVSVSRRRKNWVPPVFEHGSYVIQVKADERIVRAGELLVQVTLGPAGGMRFYPGYYKLKAYLAHRRLVDSSRFGTLMWLGYAGVLCALMIFGFKYSLAFLRNDVTEFPAKVLLLCGIFQTMHVLAIWGCCWLFRMYHGGSSFCLFALMPVALGASLCANLMGRRIGMCSAILLSALTPVLVGGEWQFQLYVQCVATSLIGVLVFQKVQLRKQFLLGGFLIVLMVLVLTTFFCIQRDLIYLLDRHFLLTLLVMSLINASIVIFGMLVFPPIFERLFDVTTVFTLNELNNRDHALLKRLATEAPGTYEHSMVVARLAADAAKAAGLNEKLAETCAYFHDIGKLFAPRKFAENLLVGDENPHDSMTPQESCSILREHIRYGEVLARKAHLPGPVREAIVQHHGTGVMRGFYAHACQVAEMNGMPVPDEKEYSYTNGQLPIRAEVVLVSIADSCEAAVRSAVHNAQTPSSTLIRDVVNSILRDKFSTCQFDHSHLTLEKLHLAVDKMMETLYAIHHVRPAYPQMPAVTEELPKES